ncbi:MAG: flagellar hook-basal body complex protein FliE [Hirschia sp.]|nr:flagellar hook-basal body complex protein FliE [Hirschia sp.]MBF17773.1 flagellar hook-basal body complex protein FliE [Hirschia sp.]
MSVNASRAYLQAAQAAQKSLSIGDNDDGLIEGAGGFSDMLSSAVSKAGQAGMTAENAISTAAMGNADLVDVVTAVAAAEATLETVVAVRDEVIKAYQEILRMPI